MPWRRTRRDGAGAGALMTEIRTLETARLKLRPYRETDIPELLPLIGTREVAATTLRSDGRQIGGAGLRVEDQHQHAELGYWLGAAYWGQGYATEAAREMMRYGFEELCLHRIFASHFKHNA